MHAYASNRSLAKISLNVSELKLWDKFDIKVLALN